MDNPEPTAKVIDFGFSCCGVKNDDVVFLPKTAPWEAPEHSKDAVSIQDAKKMDAYSFGMLCLWVLFTDKCWFTSPFYFVPLIEWLI